MWNRGVDLIERGLLKYLETVSLVLIMEKIVCGERVIEYVVEILAEDDTYTSARGVRWV